MSPQRQYRHALFLLALVLPGCTSWRPSPLDLTQVVSVEGPSTLRVTKSDGVVLVLHDARLESDSIIRAFEACRTGVDCEGTPALVAIADVDSLEVRHVDAGKTVGLILLLSVTFIALGIAHLAATDPWGD